MNQPSTRPKITLAIPFAVFPPGRLESRRIFHLYRHLCDRFTVEIVSLADAGTPHFKGVVAPGMTEIRVPKSAKHQQAEIAMVQGLGANVADATLMKLYPLTPRYLSALKKSLSTAKYALCYQPYLLPAIKAVSNKPLWYEATGIETELKRKLLPENEAGVEFWEAVSRLEAECCQKSQLIITSSKALKEELVTKLAVSSQKIVAVPNGINTRRISFVPYEQRLANKEKLGIKDSFLAIYTGTGSPHNADEARSILNMASKLQEINFLLLGNVGIFFEPRLTPPNVRFIPSIDKNTQSIIVGSADVALNPVTKITDTQSTMLEYFCQGVPVISTPLGIKELGINPREHCFVGETWRFPELLVNCREENTQDKIKRLKKVQKYVKNELEWSKISQKFLGTFNPLVLAA